MRRTDILLQEKWPARAGFFNADLLLCFCLVNDFALSRGFVQ